MITTCNIIWLVFKGYKKEFNVKVQKDGGICVVWTIQDDKGHTQHIKSICNDCEVVITLRIKVKHQQICISDNFVW